MKPCTPNPMRHTSATVSATPLHALGITGSHSQYIHMHWGYGVNILLCSFTHLQYSINRGYVLNCHSSAATLGWAGTGTEEG